MVTTVAAWSATDITDGCDLPDLNLYLADNESVFYNSSYAISGFQFTVDGATPNSVSGGDAGAAGFMLSTDAGTGIVLGFSLTGGTIPAGCGTLAVLDLTGDATGLSAIIVSDANANDLGFSYYGEAEPVPGCMDGGDTDYTYTFGDGPDGITACNYNPEATVDEGGLCEYAEENYDCDGNCTAEVDCNGDCAGSAELDECGVCNGDGIANGECDCDGNVDLGCGCGVDGPSGCDNVCGSTLEYDACGVCGGNNSSCSGCMDPSACNYDVSATIDNGSCNYPLDNFNCDGECELEDGCNDCFGIINGTAEIDDCNTCIDCSQYEEDCEPHPAWNQSCTDCAGELNGNAFIDTCEDCVGGNSGDPSCLWDCNGLDPVDPDWAGVGSIDNCGICDDDYNNDCEIDCNGDWGGYAIIDYCGHCVNGNTDQEACVPDCNGEWGGDAELDNCGSCDNDSSNDCIEDCNGVWGGDAQLDECGNCDGIGIPDGECDCAGHVFDCNDVCGGDGVLDNCNVCDNDLSNDCVPDCNGLWGGPDNAANSGDEASYDNCGVCDNDLSNDCVPDCNGVWGGDAQLDECGNCDGIGIPDGECDCDGHVFDCNDVCGGDGVLDNCNVCDNDLSNDCTPDCLGEWGGPATIDSCGVCDGEGIAAGTCDCSGNVLDDCEVCGGDGSSCSTAPWTVLTAEGGDNQITLSWLSPDGESSGSDSDDNSGEDSPNNSPVSLEIQNVDTEAGTLDIYMTNTAGCSYCDENTSVNITQALCEAVGASWVFDANMDDIACTAVNGAYFNGEVAGWAFQLFGATIDGVSGGSAEDNGGFQIQVQAATYNAEFDTELPNIFAFSLSGATISPGEGVLHTVSFSNFEGQDICFGESWVANLVTDGQPNIADPLATGNNVAVDWGDCYCALTIDCAGECGGTAVEDECGVCDGPGANVECWDGSLACDVFSCPLNPDEYSYSVFRDDVLIESGLIITSFTDTELGYSESHCYTVTNIKDNIVSEQSSESCAITNAMPDTPGCTFTSACNYDSDAIINDGSCWFSNLGCGCENDQGAVVDNCSVCDIDPTNDCTPDCNGEWGGTAVDDECGVCDGDNDCVDCSGDPFGNAVYDQCGEECIAADSSADCSAYCDADSSNDCVQDCSGEWGGILEEDMCGTCDNSTSNDCTQDCGDVWGGTGEMDLFGGCCTATEESPCIITGCDLPDSTVYLTETSMAFNSSKAIKRIKLTMEGSVIPSSPLLGAAGDAGFVWYPLTFSDSSNWVLGQSVAGTTIPAGSCGNLFNIEYLNSPVSISVEIKDENNTVIGFSAYFDSGCSGESACNYNPYSIEDFEGACAVEDCYGDCGGDALVDECGVCGGNNVCIGCTDPSAQNYDADNTIDDGSCIFGPDIISIYDAPQDQGGYVFLNWSKNTLDSLPDNIITHYSIYRFLPNERGWEYLNEVPAIGLESYGYVAPTIYTSPSDSSEIFYTSYLVNAHFEGDLYASAPDSGYSLDNLSPSVPDSMSVFSGYSNGITVNLSWAEPVDEDFLYFSLFRDGELINYLTENTYSDSPDSQNNEVAYHITATDVNGNESEPSESITVQLSVNQTVQTGIGWNWFSINVQSDDMSVNNVLSNLDPIPGDFIKSQEASAEYYDEFGWYGSLSSINPANMYQLDIENGGTISCTGYPVDPSSTIIHLTDGWNWIGYVPQNAGIINDALGSIGDSGVFIKNQAASAEYYDEFGWFGSLDFMSGGDGYQLKISGEADLIYPNFEADDNLTRAKEVKEIPEAITEWAVNPHAFEFNGAITLSVENREDSPGDYIAAFVDDECRGVAERMDFPFDDVDRGIYILMAYSNMDKEEYITFKYFSDSEEGVIEYAESLPFTLDMVVGNGFKPFSLSREFIIPTEYNLSAAYPNPFNPVTTINYGISEDSKVTIQVYNLQGRIVEILTDQNMDAGYHVVTWNADNHASGMYFVKMHAGNYISTQKLMLVK